jgi:hypothetical protein
LIALKNRILRQAYCIAAVNIVGRAFVDGKTCVRRRNAKCYRAPRETSQTTSGEEHSRSLARAVGQAEKMVAAEAHVAIVAGLQQGMWGRRRCRWRGSVMLALVNLAHVSDAVLEEVIEPTTNAPPCPHTDRPRQELSQHRPIAN